MNFYLFISLTSLVYLIGSVTLAFNEWSLTPVNIFSITIYLYPSTLYIGTILSATGALFLFLFGYYNFYRPEKKTPIIIYLVIYVLQTIIASIPQNYYGTIPPAEGNMVRPVTDLILLILFILAIGYTAFGARAKMRITTDKFIKGRLKVAIFGFILFIGFFIFYLIDEVIGQPFSLWLIPAYACIILGLIMVYIGFVTPSWSVKIIQKLAKE
mgnify:CR=1 FL=1